MIRRHSIFLAGLAVLCMATPLVAQTNYSRKIRTLPMIKLGASDPRAKSLPPMKPMERKPPAWDPYQWIIPADKDTAEARSWTLAAGTQITATLVRFNKFSVVVRLEDDREAFLRRSTLGDDVKNLITKLETEHETARVEEWKKRQEEQNTE